MANGEEQLTVEWGTNQFNITSTPDFYYATTDQQWNHSYMSVDLVVDEEMFSQEIYVNYCEAVAACSLQLDSTATVLNTLFTEGVYSVDEIMTRIDSSNPTHYSFMVEYYIGANRDSRIRALFWTYITELNTRIDSALRLVNIRPVILSTTIDPTNKTMPFQSVYQASPYSTVTNLSYAVN